MTVGKDVIERLRNWVDAEKRINGSAGNSQHGKDITALLDAYKGAVEALEPFAVYERMIRKTFKPMLDDELVNVPVRDIRRAAAALPRPEGEENEKG